jgi:hypothetical protein
VRAYDVAIADFDGDDYPDLAAASIYETTILVNSGDGTFVPADCTVPGYSVYSVAAGDFNADGLVDLATANSRWDTVSVALNNGNDAGGWMGFGDPAHYSVAGEPVNLATGDLGNDGYPELLVVTRYSDTISVLPNRGLDDGDWLGFDGAQEYDVGTYPNTVTTGYLDADDYLDVAVSSDEPGEISVLLNKQTGILKPAVTYFVTDYGLRSVTTGDVNDDGYPELAVISGVDEGSLSVLFNEGDGTFASVDRYTLGAQPYDVIVADLNGDSHPDMALANTTEMITVLFNEGAGTFAGTLDFHTSLTSRAIAAGHLDQDEYLDLAVAGGTPAAVAVLLNETTVESSDENGNGIPDECECPGDLDGDGRVDLSDLAQLLSNYGTTSGASYADGDLDGDGDVDLADLAALLAVYGTNCD